MDGDRSLSFDAIINDRQFLEAQKRMNQGILGLTKTAQTEASKLDSIFAGLGRIGLGVGITAGLAQLPAQIVKVRGEFQQLEIAFTTMLKSKEKSDKLLAEITELAATTPFGLKDVANASKQLLAFGGDAKTVVGEIRRLGDVASGVSTPIGDLVYLYGTLRTQGRAFTVDIRQFAQRGIPIYEELAKVLKINVSEVGNFVEAGKVGFKEVEQAFINMTSGSGMFSGLMEKQSKSLTGQLERLKDAIEVAFNEIGKENEGLISGLIESASTVVENYKDIAKALEVIAIAYVTYQGSVFAAAKAKQLEAATYGDVTAGINANSIAIEREIALKLQSAQATEKLKAGLADEARTNALNQKSKADMLKAEVQLLTLNKQQATEKAKSALEDFKIAKNRASIAAAAATEFQTKKAIKQADLAITKAADLEEKAFEARRQQSAIAEQLRQKRSLVAVEYSKARSLATKAEAAAEAVNTASKQAATVATTRLTFAQTAQLSVSKALAVVGRNLFALAPTAIITAISYLIIYRKELSAIVDVQERLKDAQKETTTQLAAEQAKVVALTAVITNEVASREKRARSLKELISLSPDHLKGITLENIATKESSALIEQYISAKKRQIQAKVLEKEFEESVIRENAAKSGSIGLFGQLKAGTAGFLYGMNGYRQAAKKESDAAVKSEQDFQKKLIAGIKDTSKGIDIAKEGLESGASSVLDAQKKIKSDPVYPFGSLQYWEDVIGKAENALSLLNPTNSSQIKKYQAIITSAQVEAEKARNAITKRTFDEEIEYKKNQYEQYSRWVQFISKDAADKQFADLIKSGKSYEEYLSTQIASLEAKKAASGLSETELKNLTTLKFTLDYEIQGFEKFRSQIEEAKESSQSLTDYIKVLDSEIKKLGVGQSEKALFLNDEKIQTEKERSRLLKQFFLDSNFLEAQLVQTQKKYNDLRAELDKQYADKKSQIYQEAFKEIAKREKEEIGRGIEDLLNNNFYPVEEIARMQSKSQLQADKESLAIRERVLRSLQLDVRATDEQIARAKKDVEDIKISIEQGYINLFQDIFRIFSGISSEAQGVAGIIRDMGNAVGESLGKYGQLLSLQKQITGEILSNKKRSFGRDLTKEETKEFEKLGRQITGIVALAEAAVEAIGNIAVAIQDKRKADMEYLNSVSRQQVEYNKLLFEETLLKTKRNGNIFTTDKLGVIRDSVDAGEIAAKNFDDAFNKLAGSGSAVVGKRIGFNIQKAFSSIIKTGVLGIPSGFETVDKLKPLLREYPELYDKAIGGAEGFNVALAKSLIVSNKVDERTKEMLQDTIDAVEQYKEAQQQLKDSLVDLVGNVGDMLADNLVQAFAQGETAAMAFGKTMEQVLGEVVKQAVKLAVIKPLLDRFQADVLASFDPKSGDMDIIDDIERFIEYGLPGIEMAYDKIAKASDYFNKKYGYNIFGGSSTSNPNSLTGAIKGMTEETAGILAGQFNAIRITNVQILDVTRQALLHQFEIRNNTLRTAVAVEEIAFRLRTGDSSMGNRAAGL